MKQEPEYAPQYTKAEQWRRMLIAIAITVPLLAFFEWIFFPWYNEFGDTAACRTLFGRPGLEMYLYIGIVGLPILIFLAMSAFILPLALRTLNSGQYPPPGQKTHRRIRIRRGHSATLIAWGQIAALTVLFIMPFYGAYIANDILQKAHTKYPDGIPCEAGIPKW